jgi:hypothetical protein
MVARVQAARARGVSGQAGWADPARNWVPQTPQIANCCAAMPALRPIRPPQAHNAEILSLPALAVSAARAR